MYIVHNWNEKFSFKKNYHSIITSQINKLQSHSWMHTLNLPSGLNELPHLVLQN